jgi:hypothetical protein
VTTAPPWKGSVASSPQLHLGRAWDPARSIALTSTPTDLDPRFIETGCPPQVAFHRKTDLVSQLKCRPHVAPNLSNFTDNQRGPMTTPRA